MVRRRVVVGLVAVCVAMVLVGEPRALARATCSFEPSERLVRVTVGAVDASPATVSVGPASDIGVDGSACASSDGATATLLNTSAIVATGSPNDDLLTIDLTGGAFGDVVWSVDLGDGSDTLAVVGTDDRDWLTVGSAGFSFDGSDGSYAGVEAFELRGLAGPDILSAAGSTDETGGPISDPVVFLGGPGNDRLESGLGGDVFRGGLGRDLVSYLSHETGVTATLDGIANDGMNGEDFIHADVENLMGGMGEDHLVGNAAANRLAGAAGSDLLEGGDGRDRLRGERDADRLVGGAGDDLLRGSSGEDLLEGGEGRDELRGDRDPDALRGGPGDDTFLAQDGWIDSVVGGRGIDSAYVDADDEVTGCEEVQRLEPPTADEPS